MGKRLVGSLKAGQKISLKFLLENFGSSHLRSSLDDKAYVAVSDIAKIGETPINTALRNLSYYCDYSYCGDGIFVIDKVYVAGTALPVKHAKRQAEFSGRELKPLWYTQTTGFCRIDYIGGHKKKIPCCETDRFMLRHAKSYNNHNSRSKRLDRGKRLSKTISANLKANGIDSMDAGVLGILYNLIRGLEDWLAVDKGVKCTVQYTGGKCTAQNNKDTKLSCDDLGYVYNKSDDQITIYTSAYQMQDYLHTFLVDDIRRIEFEPHSFWLGAEVGKSWEEYRDIVEYFSECFESCIRDSFECIHISGAMQIMKVPCVFNKTEMLREATLKDLEVYEQATALTDKVLGYDKTDLTKRGTILKAYTDSNNNAARSISSSFYEAFYKLTDYTTLERYGNLLEKTISNLLDNSDEALDRFTNIVGLYRIRIADRDMFMKFIKRNKGYSEFKSIFNAAFRRYCRNNYESNIAKYYGRQGWEEVDKQIALYDTVEEKLLTEAAIEDNEGPLWQRLSRIRGIGNSVYMGDSIVPCYNVSGFPML